MLKNQFICPVIIRAPCTKIGWIRRPVTAVQTVFQATVISKLQLYASSAWCGFTNAAQRDQLKSFLRRAVKDGFHKDNSPTLSAICEAADDVLFRRTSPCHPLRRLLTPQNVPPYDLRPRTHQYQLPDERDSLVARNYNY